MKVINYNGKMIRISPENGQIEESTNGGSYWNFLDHNQTSFGKINELYVWKNQILGLTDEFLISSTNGYSWIQLDRISCTNCGHITDITVNGDELLVFKDGAIWYSDNGYCWLRK